VAESCGANFCGVSDTGENPNLQPPAVERIHLISGIYLGCMIVACLMIAFCVDSLSRYAFILRGLTATLSLRLVIEGTKIEEARD